MAFLAAWREKSQASDQSMSQTVCAALQPVMVSFETEWVDSRKAAKIAENERGQHRQRDGRMWHLLDSTVSDIPG